MLGFEVDGRFCVVHVIIIFRNRNFSELFLLSIYITVLVVLALHLCLLS